MGFLRRSKSQSLDPSLTAILDPETAPAMSTDFGSSEVDAVVRSQGRLLEIVAGLKDGEEPLLIVAGYGQGLGGVPDISGQVLLITKRRVFEVGPGDYYMEVERDGGVDVSLTRGKPIGDYPLGLYVRITNPRSRHSNGSGFYVLSDAQAERIRQALAP